MLSSPILVVLSILFFCSQATGAENLSILLIVSNSVRFNTSGALEVFELALERINREPSLLSGYELNSLQYTDNKVYMSMRM